MSAVDVSSYGKDIGEEPMLFHGMDEDDLMLMSQEEIEMDSREKMEAWTRRTLVMVEEIRETKKCVSCFLSSK